MLKRILQTCAAAALMASSAFAGNAAGIYSTSTPDGKLEIELRPLQDDLLRGTVHYGTQDYPIIAKQVGDNLNGTWERDGKHVIFTSKLNGQTLTLNTNGTTYTLEKAGEPVTAPAPAIESQPIASTPRQASETREGKAFRYVVPQGWQVEESIAGVDMMAPDGVTIVSHAFLFIGNISKPDQVFQLLLAQAKNMMWSDVKVESSTPRDQNGALGMTYSLNYKFKGTPVHSEVVVIVYTEGREHVARVVGLQTSPDAFEQREPMLMELAHKIEVTHPEIIKSALHPAREESPTREITRDPVRDRDVDALSDAKGSRNLDEAYQARQTRMTDAADQMDRLMRGG